VHEKITSWLMGLGVACLVVVVLTDLAEQFEILPEMGWGRDLNLASALVGTAAITMWLITRPSK